MCPRRSSRKGAFCVILFGLALTGFAMEEQKEEVQQEQEEEGVERTDPSSCEACSG